MPGTLGMGLVEGYDSVNLPLAYPELRAELERDLKLICTGERNPEAVLQEQIEKYKEVYRIITARIEAMDVSLANRYVKFSLFISSEMQLLNEKLIVICYFRLQAVPAAAPAPNLSIPSINPVFTCPKCKKYHMSLRAKKENNGYFFTCLGRPECNHAIWLADEIKEIKVHDDECNKCRNGNKKVVIKFKSSNLLGMLNASCIDDNDRTYVSCILCDQNLQQVLEINQMSLRGDQNTSVNRSQANNRNFPTQNPVRTNANTQSQNRPNNNRPTATLPNPRPNANPNPNANQSFRNTGNVKCSGCNQPAVK